MGIIIINGKKYDSSTGMMISRPTPDDFADIASPAIKADMAKQSPSWLENYVDASENAESDVDNNVDLQDQAEATEVNPVDEAIKSSVSNESSDPIESNEATKADESRRTSRASARVRRSVAESRTLNRRFVKKPLGKTGEYAESIAVKSIKANSMIAPAVSAAKSIEVSAAAETVKVAKAVKPAVPARAVQVKKHESNAQPARRQVVPTAKSWDDATTKQNIRNLNDESIDNDIAELARILQNDSDYNAGWGNSKSSRPARQKARARQKRQHTFKFPAVMATAGAMAAVAGITFYMLSPTISIRMAASKAGIDGKNPYTPSGYSIDGTVAYKTGSITINYKNEAGKKYSVTQEAKQSSSVSSIRNEISHQNNGNYREIKTDSAQVIMYDDKASWLKNGVLYTITGSDNLDKTQISNIVDSV